MNICDEKIILYGNKKIQGDFKILFSELNVADGDIYSNMKYIKEEPKGYFIVVCEKREDAVFQNIAETYELRWEEHYVYIKDFFRYYNPVFLKRKNRKLAVWGTGTAASELWEVFAEKGLASEIDFYIDNMRGKTSFKGKRVVSPEEIKSRDDLYIIVAAYKNHWEIYKQLEEYGFRQKNDYDHCATVSKNYSELLEKVCFEEKRYPYHCNRPFGYCDVIGGELYLCCPDFLPVSAGNMQYAPFLDCWNSYMARIIRLSILNGTFAFCNRQYCDLIDFEDSGEKWSKPEIEDKNIYPAYPNTLMVGIDYSCNLHCPSCRKELCIAKADERIEMDRQAEDLLEHVIPNVGRLWMAGSGEVFFSQVYRKILNDGRCKQRGNISILSNGTLFNEKEWVLLEKNYNSIEVVISMDGIKDETIEKLRRGANAQKLKENLAFLGRMRKVGKIRKLFVNCVLQAEDAGELYELLEYCRNIGVDKVQFLKLKDNGNYTEWDCFDKVSIFNRNGSLKEEYSRYFTKELLEHPLADWFNSTRTLGTEKKRRLNKYDTL